MQDLTQADLDRLKDLEAATTRGPWEYFGENQEHCFEGETLWRYGIWVEADQLPVICMTPVHSNCEGIQQLSNMDFVAAARNALPSLLAELTRRREESIHVECDRCGRDTLRVEGGVVKGAHVCDECCCEAEATAQHATALLRRCRDVLGPSSRCTSDDPHLATFLAGDIEPLLADLDKELGGPNG